MDPDLTETMMWLENTTLLRNYSPSLALSNCTQVDEVTLPGFELPPLDWLLTLKIVALIFMILLTIVGNLIVIVAVVRSPSLRSPTHALIINLAVADLLLGATVLPLSATREIVGVWLLGPELCSVWTTLDVLCCTASILSLCGISVDRYIGVSRPLAYSRIMTRRRVKVLIAAIWALALAISVAPPLGWREAEGVVEAEESECHVNKQLGYVIFSACGSFYLPALVILVLYALVYRAAIRHSKFLDSGSRVTRSEVTLRVHTGPSRAGSLREPNAVRDKGGGGSPLLFLPPSTVSVAGEVAGGVRRLTGAGVYGRAAKFRRQKKAAKTLGIVVGGFLLCWFPFFVILPIDAACSSCDLSGIPFNFAFWLGYFNSCINPFIYACTSRELRRAFHGTICGRHRSLHRQPTSLLYRPRAPSVTSNISVNVHQAR